MLYLGPLAFFGAYLYARASGAPDTWRRLLGGLSAALFVLAYIGSALGTPQLDGRLRFVIIAALITGLVLVYRTGLRRLRQRFGKTGVIDPPAPSGTVLIAEDGGLVADLRAHAEAEGLAQMDAPFSLLKRDEAGGILAACRAQIDGPLVHLSDLWVAPEARHRGEGRALVTQLLDEARTRGAERALATTATPEAGSFVQALGFERVLDVPPGAPERVIWSHRL